VSIVSYAKQVLDERGFAFTMDDLKQMIDIALSVGGSYLFKNLFEKKDGENTIVSGVMGTNK
jgi:hypothetical protein